MSKKKKNDQYIDCVRESVSRIQKKFPDAQSGPGTLCREVIEETVNATIDYLNLQKIRPDAEKIIFLNPLTMVVESARIVNKRRGNKPIQCYIQFGQPEDVEDMGALGVTSFPDDGSAPVVTVRADLPLQGACDILSHELSHVIIGEACEGEDEHGEEFESVYEEIYQAFCELFEEYQKEHGNLEDEQHSTEN